MCQEVLSVYRCQLSCGYGRMKLILAVGKIWWRWFSHTSLPLSVTASHLITTHTPLPQIFVVFFFLYSASLLFLFFFHSSSPSVCFLPGDHMILLSMNTGGKRPQHFTSQLSLETLDNGNRSSYSFKYTSSVSFLVIPSTLLDCFLF